MRANREAMSILRRLFGREALTDDEKKKRAAQLEARRKHLRGRISKTSGEIHRAWTEYRTWRGEDSAAKKKLRARIKHLEAQRKEERKEMLKVAAEMKKLGFDAAAGHVDLS